jgi:hypothetical protein
LLSLAIALTYAILDWRVSQIYSSLANTLGISPNEQTRCNDASHPTATFSFVRSDDRDAREKKREAEKLRNDLRIDNARHVLTWQSLLSLKVTSLSLSGNDHHRVVRLKTLPDFFVKSSRIIVPRSAHQEQGTRMPLVYLVVICREQRRRCVEMRGSPLPRLHPFIRFS